MKNRMVYEMNKAHLYIAGDEFESQNDYRARMLENNEIKNIIQPESRIIDGEKEIFYDVTDRESLFNYMIKRIVDRENIKDLFRSIWRFSESLKELLIDEENIILDPELIFRNIRTGEYEFICIPKKQGNNDDIKKLLQFIMTRIDNSDEQLVDTIFDIYNKTDSSVIKYSIIYETIQNSLMSEEMVDIEAEEDKEEVPSDMGRRIYIPSLIEACAYGLCLLGIVIIGVNLYRSFI